MAPTLTDQQRRIDETLDLYVSRWNLLNVAQKASPDGMQLRDLLLNLTRQRSGAEAAAYLGKVMDPRIPLMAGPEIRSRLDSRYPRLDGSLPGPTSPAPTTPPAPVPAASSSQSGGDIFNAEPGDGRLWLPGNAKLPHLSGDDAAALNDRDRALQAANAALFGVDPARAWQPAGAQLITGTNISTLGGAHDRAGDLLGKLTAALDALKGVFGRVSEEPLIAAQVDLVKPAVSSVEAGVTASRDLQSALSKGAVAANDAFHQLRGQSLDIRRDMEDRAERLDLANKVDFVAAAVLGGARPLTTFIHLDYTDLPSVSSPAKADEVAGAVGQIKTVTDAITVPQVVAKEDVTPTSAVAPGGESAGGSADGGGGAGAGSVAPAVSLPPAGLPGAGGSAPPGAAAAGDTAKGLGTDDLTELLTQLGNSAVPLAQQAAQQAAQLPQQLAQLPQQAAQIPQQAANAIQRAVNPTSDLVRKLRGEDDPKLVADKAAADTADRDRAAATEVAYTPPKPAEASALGAPGSPARPHQLDAAGKPVDGNRDGKVDATATPLSKASVKPFDLNVPAEGQNVLVKGVPDPRLGEMMLDMADSKGGQPLSVLDAAKAAGMDIPALGDPMDPKQVKVGNAVIGDAQSGLYLGEGKVLTSTGLVENIDDVLGKNGFVSEIPLPELPADKPAAAEGTPNTQLAAATPEPAPAAAQTGPAPAPAPPAAPAPPVPVSAPAAAPPPPPAAPAPAPAAPPPPAAPALPADSAGGKPVAKGSGLPLVAPYEGHPLT